MVFAAGLRYEERYAQNLFLSTSFHGPAVGRYMVRFFLFLVFCISCPLLLAAIPAQSDNRPIVLGQRAVALLRLLLERAGAPVSKDALFEAAWPGLAVEDSNLTVQVAAIRRTFGELAGGADWIETLPRRGYPSVTSSKTRRTAAI